MVLYLDFTICITWYFRGLDLTYMPSPPALQIMIVPTPARLWLHSVHPHDSSTREHHQVLPRNFAAEDQDKARFRTGRGS
jgi:hypothetical protein